jgi:proline iminopeptidase
MNRIPLIVLAVLPVAVLSSTLLAEEERKPGELFPPAKPLQLGMLKVSDVHTVAFARFGNPEGKPVFVLHGGPGFGCYPRLTQYFDPDKFHIILADQRGAGRSLPSGEIRENTTQDLVEDIERLRKHLGIDQKILVFGGSWGSTLALAYAEAHPEQVAGMVLRGVFTATEIERNQVYGGSYVRRFYPDAMARLQKELPPGYDGLQPEQMLKAFTGDDRETAMQVAQAGIHFGVKIEHLLATDEMVNEGFGDWNPIPAFRIDCHYAVNKYFLEEGQLLRDADRLRDIPITIIQGRYDMICPPIAAWRLHECLPKSKLIIVEQAGHVESEEGTTRALVQTVAEFE